MQACPSPRVVVLVKPRLVASAFILISAFFFLIFCFGLILLPDVYVAPHRSAAAVAILHSAILGWLLPAGFGSVYLLLPVLKKGANGDGLAMKTHFCLHVVALCLILPAFSRWELSMAAHAGSLILLGFVICMLFSLYCMEGSRRLPMVQITIVSSLTWLLLALVMGILAATNHYWSILPMSTLVAIHAGMHAGFGGYMVLFLMGVSYALFQVETVCSMERRLWVFFLCNGGVYFTVLGLAFNLPVVNAAALFSLCGFGIYVVEILEGLQWRDDRAGAWDWGFLIGLAAIFVLMGFGLVLGNFQDRSPDLIGRLENLYGFLWITFATGLPFWMIIGRALVPRAGDRHLSCICLLYYLASGLVVGWGIYTGNVRLVRMGGFLLLAGGSGLLFPILSVITMVLFAPGTATASTLEPEGMRKISR